MSGYGWSYIRYDRKAELLNSLNNGYNNTKSKLDHLFSRYNSLEEALKEAYRSRFYQKAESIRRNLQDQKSKLEEGRTLLDKIVIPKSTANTTETYLETLIGKVSEVNSHLSQVEGIYKEIDSDIVETNITDKRLVNILKEVSFLEGLADGSRGILEKWAEEEFDFFNRKIARIRIKLQEMIRQAEIKSDDFIGEEGEISKIKSEIVRIIKEAKEKEDFNQKRLLTLRALRQVGADLGFRELRCEHSQKGDYNSLIILSFNTKKKGKIDFSLNLEGIIESNSNIENRYCREQFDEISEKLKDDFGVITEFSLESDGKGVPSPPEKKKKKFPASHKIERKMGRTN